jgi:hypothetical protein
MSATTLRQFDEKRFALFLGLSLLLHVMTFLSLNSLDSIISGNFLQMDNTRRPLKIHTLGIKRDKPVDSSIYLKPQVAKSSIQPRGARSSKGKALSFKDLTIPQESIKLPNTTVSQSTRPGTMPKTSAPALQGLRFNNQELKKMAQESYSGNSQIFGSDKISLRYEVPDGKNLDELNEAELRLYSFLKRGAKNYATSVAAELHDFTLKYPHLHFPMSDDKHVMTGRMTYDKNGNLKQIKMVRWTNNDKLQQFFENVLKRMEIMQNPPKELWADNNDEFTIFMTLQING